ncbi:coiled-coil domain-containing protein 115 [Megalops cyprinoides]|uniref:coiled-coil domain-containing protein 115 n=1 Tax=Megalops cyprinoides TaxID=118141 RepID=UPI001864D741|nr:coiled-coil domain-containing protein 115 [Megalops cyprinoides]
MGVEMNEASLRLDERLLHFMDQLELLEEKRERLNSLIEQGWFSISKARYAMGNKQVSALQYGSEIEPRVYIHARTMKNGEAEFHAERLEQQNLQDSEKDPRPVEEIGPKEEGLRRRVTAKTEDPKEKPVASESPVSKEDSGRPNRVQPQHQDPLNWFGILVPQSLKQAQQAFKKVIELSAEVATLQSAVMATRKELQSLMGEKRMALVERKAPIQADEPADS